MDKKHSKPSNPQGTPEESPESAASNEKILIASKARIANLDRQEALDLQKVADWRARDEQRDADSLPSAMALDADFDPETMYEDQSVIKKFKPERQGTFSEPSSVRGNVLDAYGNDAYRGVDIELFKRERIYLHTLHQMAAVKAKRRRGDEATVEPPARNLVAAWELLCDLLNTHLKDGQLPESHPFYQRLIKCQLPVGGGKSTGLAIWAGILAGIAGTPEKCPPVLIVNERKKDCDRLAKQINEYATKWYGASGQFAQAWHGDIDRDVYKLSDMAQFPFLICTQKGLVVAMLFEEIDRLYRKNLSGYIRFNHPQPGRDPNEFGYGIVDCKCSWEDKRDGVECQCPKTYPRLGIIIDEELDPYVPFKINKHIVEKIAAEVSKLPDKIKDDPDVRDFLNGLGWLLGSMTLFSVGVNPESTQRTIDDTDLTHWRKEYIGPVPLINKLRSYKIPKTEPVYPDDDEPTPEQIAEAEAEARAKDAESFLRIWNIIERLVGIYYIYEKGQPLFYWKEDQYTDISFQLSVFILDTLRRAPMILDATSSRSQMYTAFHTALAPKIDKVRDYSNLTISIDTSVGCSRRKLVGELKRPGAKTRQKMTFED